MGQTAPLSDAQETCRALLKRPTIPGKTTQQVQTPTCVVSLRFALEARKLDHTDAKNVENLSVYGVYVLSTSGNNSIPLARLH